MPEETASPAMTIPMVEETPHITKRTVETGRVRVAVATEEVPTALHETLRGRRVEVERVAIGRVLGEDEAPPATREEADTLIIPILEETAVVVKRLVLREEVRLRFVTEQVPFRDQVTLRRETATVERLASASRPAASQPDPEKETSR